MLRATKIRIYPTPEQAAFLNAQFGAVRFAYNKALHIKKHAYQRHGVNLSPRNDLKPLLSVAKKSRKYAWLKEFDSMALQQAVINIDVAFSNFFNPKLKARFPTFKRKHGKQSSYHCVGIAYSALFDHGLASKSDQRFASIRSTGNLTFSTAF